MTNEDVPKAFADLCKAGQFEEAGRRFWAEDVTSIEAMPGDMSRVSGIAALKAKGDWWMENHEVHESKAEGPFPNGDQFAMIFDMDVTPKVGPMAGSRIKLREVGLYTVKDGKITEERFFYGTGG